MVVAAAGAGKTLRLQPAAAVVAAGIRRARRQVLRLPVTADSPLRQAPASTFKASPGRLVPATITTAIWGAVVVVVLLMVHLRILAVGRCSVAVAAVLGVERLLSLL